MSVRERREREKQGLGQEVVPLRKFAGRIESLPTTLCLHFADKADLLRDETPMRLHRERQANWAAIHGLTAIRITGPPFRWVEREAAHR